MTELVSLSTIEDGIALLALQDEAGKNAFSEPFIEALLARLADLAQDREIRVCLVRGTDEVFCAGASQETLAQLAGGAMAASDILLPKVVLDLPIPMVAAMEGHAVGGGLALGLCCDVVLMARESRYGASFMNMGFTPGMGSTRLLQYAVGEYIAAELLLGGQLLKGSHFDGRGAINYVLPKAKVWKQALRVARGIAEKPRFALETLKRYLSLPRRQTFEETRTVETLMHQLSFARPETAVRIREYYEQVTRGS